MLQPLCAVPKLLFGSTCKREHLDGPVKAFQALSGDAVVCEVAPVGTVVAVALQEGDVGFTDDDVIWSCVVVQLLVPVLAV